MRRDNEGFIAAQSEEHPVIEAALTVRPVN